MTDKPLAIAQMVAALVSLAETEFEHVWNLIHAVQAEGTSSALLRNAGELPPIPKQ